MDILKDIDIEKIVEESLRTSGAIPERLDEALVAQPKKYTQVSETVSQRTKDAHSRLYDGYIEKFNRVSAELDSVSKEADSNDSTYRQLKVSETFNLNGIWLHELYFANCFDPTSEITANSLVYMRLQRDFGTFDDWQRHFMACALSAREGWAVCGYSTFVRKFVNTFIDGHSQNVPLGFYPILVVDMWSHAYYRDYLDDKHSYLVTQMREINWDVVNDRVLRAEKIGDALK